MKFIYTQKSGIGDMAYLVVGVITKELQESDIRDFKDGIGIKLNRFLYKADPETDFILFCDRQRVKASVVCQRHSKSTPAHCCQISLEEELSIYRALKALGKAVCDG